MHIKEKEKEEDKSPQREECRYYRSRGGCRYGNGCRYVHRGVKECQYFERGNCKYGSKCNYHHTPKVGKNAKEEEKYTSHEYDNRGKMSQRKGMSQQWYDYGGGYGYKGTNHMEYNHESGYGHGERDHPRRTNYNQEGSSFLERIERLLMEAKMEAAWKMRC